MKKQIFNNWILKLVSVVCAMMLWIIVYNSEDPVEVVRFYNVPVEFENTDVLEQDGKVYEVLGNSDMISSIRVRAKRSVTSDLNKSDVRVVADFRNMKMDGTIDLEVYCTRYSKGEIEFELSSKQLKLFAESKAETSTFIYVETVGTPADGYMVYDAKTTHNRITVSGGKSVIDRIDKAVALVDVSGANGDIITYVDLVLYDSNGVAISKEKVSMNVEYEQATVNIFPTKTVPVRYEISGTPAEGYVPTGNVTYETESLLVMGRPATLSSISEILVKGEGVSIEGAEGNVSLTLDLDNYLPTGIFRADRESHNGRIHVEVEVVPIVEQEFELKASQVEIVNIPKKIFADRTSDTELFKVIIRGAQHLLEQIDESKLKGEIDLLEWMNENNVLEVSEGTVYKIVPKFDLGEEFTVVDSKTIDVVIGVVKEE